MRARTSVFRLTAAALLPLLPLLTSACQNLSADCTSIGRFGLSVSVRDVRTGLPPSVGSMLTVRDGAYVETHPTPQSPQGESGDFGAANNRPGTYDLELTTPGYRSWTQSKVVVAADACGHPKTVFVTATITAL